MSGIVQRRDEPRYDRPALRGWARAWILLGIALYYGA